MLRVYPDYYNKFKCIATKCSHNCCIGWEIDIDRDSFDFYSSLTGDFGKKLKENIDTSNEPHFVLGEKERCPFLNKDNLCDIIITLGEENLCEICREHPRFHNFLPDRTESGLGLCCEAAAELILGKKEPVTFVCEGETPLDYEIIELRDQVLKLLQNRQKDIENRIDDLFDFFEIEKREIDFMEFSDVLLDIERLDEKWTDLLLLLKQNIKGLDLADFLQYISERQTEYEQLLVYIIYRHFVNSCDMYEVHRIVRFAHFAYKLIFSCGAVIYGKKGEFTFSDQVELVRMFSSEIEYSDENMELICDRL